MQKGTAILFLFAGLLTFCLNDVLDIPATVENSDHSYRAAAVIYDIIDDEIVYPVPDASPCFSTAPNPRQHIGTA